MGRRWNALPYGMDETDYQVDNKNFAFWYRSNHICVAKEMRHTGVQHKLHAYNIYIPLALCTTLGSWYPSGGNVLDIDMSVPIHSLPLS
jgi:hypothetical protein